MKRWACFVALCLTVWTGPTAWGSPLLQGQAQQGGLVVGQAPMGLPVMLDDRPVAVAPDGLFILGFGRDAPPQAVLTIGAERHVLDIAPRLWPEQHINGLPDAKVTPDPAQLERIRQDGALLAERRQHSAPDAYFRAGLTRPADGPVSGVFGSRRILNGQARAPHSGLDIAGPQGAPVWATAPGRVVLVHADMALTGATLLIDHGLGLSSVYAHLSQIHVQDGQWVAAGQTIGRIGQSGRASGPHLHFGLSWQDIRLDPQTVLDVLAQGQFNKTIKTDN